MATATNETDCIERHVDYPYDVARDSMNALQRSRLTVMFSSVMAGESVLDVGCNSGYAIDFLPNTCRVSGVDVSPDLVRKASSRLVDARVAKAEDLPYDDNSFDVVALGEILEHVYDPTKVMTEAARVAKRCIVGSTPHELGAWGSHRVESHEFHVRCFNRTTLTNLLSPYGQPYITTIPVDRVPPHMYVFSVQLWHGV